MSREKIVIFGAGEIGRRIYRMVKDEKDVLFFVDNDRAKWGEEALELKIQPPAFLRDYKEYDQVIIANIFATADIFRQLLNLGVPPEKCATDYAARLFKEWRSEIDKAMETGEKTSFFDDILTYWTTYQKEEYERRWQEIKQKHNAIKIFQLDESVIGETIPLYFAIRHNEIQEPNVLKVFLPFMRHKRICNRALLNLLNQHIYAPQGEEALFWAYVCKNHPDDLDLSQFKGYFSRFERPAIPRGEPAHEVELYHHDFLFAEKETGYAREQMKKMRLRDDFVCVGARTAAYNLKTVQDDLHYAFRNVDVRTYANALDYLEKFNLQGVRMGREESAMTPPMNNCIDYAGQCASDFMDLYLAAHCKFMIANITGLSLLPSLFGRPLVVVNAVVFSHGFTAFPYTKNDLYIPKKYFGIRRGKYLSLMESVSLELQCGLDGEKYADAGIRFEDNSPEEIQEAVAEFLARLNGTWEDTEEDIENYERYKQIHDEMKRVRKDNVPIPYRISATYLRKNKYLLE